MRTLILLLLAVTGAAAQAEIYKWTDPQTGNVVYSDQPIKGSRRMELPEAQTYTNTPVPPQPDTDTKSPSPDQPPYAKFSIANPRNEDTIRNTAGVVEVTLALVPALKAQDGDRITLVLDNAREYGPTSDLKFSLSGVERGTHTLQAMIKDGQGQVIQKSTPVTIFVKQASRLQPKPSPIPNPNPVP